MSFNTKSGYPLVRINGKGSMNKKIIRIDDKDKVQGEKFSNLSLTDNYEFIPIPNMDAERTTLLVVGMAGSGKSYFVAQWLKEYRKMFDYPIYIFSEKVEDKQLDEIKGVMRIKLTTELGDLDYTEFKESCCVFDDVDSLEKNLRRVVNGIRDKLLKLGRAQKTTVVSTNHSPTDGLDTKALLNEAQSIVFFMNNYNRSLKYLLENYLGASKEDIKQMKKNKSRWTCWVKQTHPNVIIQRRNMFIPNDFIDSESSDSDNEDSDNKSVKSNKN